MSAAKRKRRRNKAPTPGRPVPAFAERKFVEAIVGARMSDNG
jgi:hypothetical protein